MIQSSSASCGTNTAPAHYPLQPAAAAESIQGVGMNGLPPPPLCFLVLRVERSTFGVDKGGWQSVYAYHLYLISTTCAGLDPGYEVVGGMTLLAKFVACARKAQGREVYVFDESLFNSAWS
jgi:hypothetical protein